MDACFSVQPWFKMHRAPRLRRCRGGKLTGGHVDRVPASQKWSLLWQVFYPNTLETHQIPNFFPCLEHWWHVTVCRRCSLPPWHEASAGPHFDWTRGFKIRIFGFKKKKKVVDQVEISASDVRWKQKAEGGGRGQEKQRLMKRDEGGGGGC